MKTQIQFRRRSATDIAAEQTLQSFETHVVNLEYILGSRAWHICMAALQSLLLLQHPQITSDDSKGTPKWHV